MNTIDLNRLRKFVSPEVIFGLGSRKLAGTSALQYGATHVLVVTDPGIIAAGWSEDVISSIESAGLKWTLFSEVTPNPKAPEVMAGAQVYRQKSCDAIVAVGGGSVIDCAKGIGIVASNEQSILRFEGADQICTPMPPLICIPTTGGTAADVSQFAIISDPRERRKIAIISKSVVPDVSLVDPETLLTMDPYLTACTGLDAMVHAIEAYLSVSSSHLTDMHALNALNLLSQNLEASVNNPSNLEHRTQVMLGSLQAGLAFSNASLGATHAMAHSLGGLLDSPHGECNAILLTHVIDFNYAAAPERCRRIAHAMGLELAGLSFTEAKGALIKRISEIRQAVGVSKTLGQTGVHRTDIPALAKNAAADICLVTNPRRANIRDIEVIYEESL